jgi:hypothetical protein
MPYEMVQDPLYIVLIIGQSEFDLWQENSFCQDASTYQV